MTDKPIREELRDPLIETLNERAARLVEDNAILRAACARFVEENALLRRMLSLKDQDGP